jgi:hypothetical protein
MLTRTKLRALSPGQWARVRIPDYESWRKPGEGFCPTNPGDEVDICVMPVYSPRYDSRTQFHWNYRVAYRGPKSNWANHQSPAGAWISTWEFGLIDPSLSGPNWDKDTCHEHHEGKGKWLYEPASDDPELCPGGDWSRYLCDVCQKYVKPFSADDGTLICPTCEATGLVILDDEQLDRLEQVREFARLMGLGLQLERQLCFLAHERSGEKTDQCILSYDFAPHSFSFCRYILPAYARSGERTFSYNGAMIYQGPNCPADGSFPSLTVSLASGTGWFCHT